MHKLEFELKQHTPIIHFQARDIGATLRASEVKPKLDRFLLREYEKEIPQSVIKRGTEEDHRPSLDFKIKFISQNAKRESANKAPMYFGNLKSDKPKRLVFDDNGVSMIILVRDDTLRGLIENGISKFFLLHNFGSRQSKGYGSFTIANQGLSGIRSLYKYSFEIKSKDYNDVLKQINYFYKSLRSGINEYRTNRDGKPVSLFYFKSALHYYTTTSLRKQWDKRSIKQYFLEDQLKEEEKKYNTKETFDEDKLDFRDLFGLSSMETWKQFNIIKTCKSLANKDIHRLKSPIQFKPIFVENKCMVFFDVFTEDVGFDEFLGSKVTVNAFRKERGNQPASRFPNPIKEALELSVPEDVDLREVLDYIFSNIDAEKRVAPLKSKGGEGEKILKDLKSIYASLKIISLKK